MSVIPSVLRKSFEIFKDFFLKISKLFLSVKMKIIEMLETDRSSYDYSKIAHSDILLNVEDSEYTIRVHFALIKSMLDTFKSTSCAPSSFKPRVQVSSSQADAEWF